MLKIKDNVDLKELEKFGFEYCMVHYNSNLVYRWSNDKNIIIIGENETTKIKVYERKDYDMGISNEMLEKIFDLIQAGLIEKVVENERN